MKAFCLDANIFFESNKSHYPMDIFPVFWTFLEKSIASGNAVVPESVWKGVAEVPNKDGAAKWLKERRGMPNFCVPVDDLQQDKFRLVANYVEGAYRTSPYKDEFLDGADPWIIALAMARDAIVVTFETAAPSSSPKIKIPNVCAHFGVRCVNCQEMLRAFGAVFG